MKPTIGIEEEFIVVDKNYNPVNYKFDDFNEEYYSKENIIKKQKNIFKIFY